VSDRIEKLSERWLSVKENEESMANVRRDIEDEIRELSGAKDSESGVTDASTKTHTVKVTTKVNHTVDGDKLQEIANESGLMDRLSDLFRWKPSISKKAWDQADEAVKRKLSGAITSKPGRATIKIERKEQE
jgi:hypothetical protein